MKFLVKMYGLILSLSFGFLFLTALSACKEDPVPTVELTVKSLNNDYPGEVSFTTNATPGKKKWTINGYQLQVIAPDGTQKPVAHQETGKFPNMVFPQVGTWKVEVIVSDKNGSAVEATKELTIKDPFADFTFNKNAPALDEEQGVTEGVPFVLNKAYIDTKFHSFLDRIAFSVKNEEGAEVWGKELDLSVEDEITFNAGLSGKGLVLCAVAYDKYNNASVQIESPIFLNSKQAPVVRFKMYAQRPGADIKNPDRFEVAQIEAGTVTATVYEFSTVWFNASTAKPSGVEGDGSQIESIEYDLFVVDSSTGEDVLREVDVSTTYAAETEVAFELASAATYELRIKITNSVGYSSIGKVRIPAVENKPRISAVNLQKTGQFIYEALAYNIDIEARSLMPGMGTLTKAVVTFGDDGTGKKIVYEVPIQEGQTPEFQWEAFIYDNSEESNICNGYAVVRNVAGRESDPFPFSWRIWDNRPNVSMNVSPIGQTIPFGSEITVTSSSVLKMDSRLTFTVTQMKDKQTKTIADVTTSEIVDPNNSDYVQKQWKFTTTQFADNDDGDVTYLLSLVQINDSGRAVVQKVFTATNQQSFVTFDIVETKYYADKTITLDAGMSRKNGNQLTDEEFKRLKIKVKKSSDSTDYVAEGSAIDSANWNGLIKYNSEGRFTLTLGAADYYSITLSGDSGEYNGCSIVNKTVLVENKAPKIQEVVAIPIRNESASRPIRADEPGHIKELKYKLEVRATIEDDDPIEFNWYIDNSPAYSEVKPDFKPSGSNNCVSVEGVWLTPGEHTVFVIGNIVGEASNASRPFRQTITVNELTAPRVVTPYEDSSYFTNEQKPQWNTFKGDVSNTDQFRWQLLKEGVAETESGWSAPMSGDAMATFRPQSNLAEGNWVLYVQERNSKDGRWSNSGFAKVTVDITPPPAPVVAVNDMVTISNGVDGDPRRTADGKANKVWSWQPHAASEELSAYSYRFRNGDPWTEVFKSENQPAALEEDLVEEEQAKEVAIQVRAKDLAGNWSESVSSKIVIDRKAPISPTGDTTEEWTNNTALNFFWTKDSLSEKLKGYKVVLKKDDGATGEFETVTEVEIAGEDQLRWTSAPQNQTPLTVYQLEVYAVDLVGNESIPIVLTRKLDTVAPSAPQSLALTGGGGQNNAGKNTNEFSFTYAPPLDTNGIAGYICGYATQGIAINYNTPRATTDYSVTGITSDGYRTVGVKAVDLAGNIGAAATMDFYRDTMPPVITLKTDLLTFNFGDAKKSRDEIKAEAFDNATDVGHPAKAKVTFEYPFPYIDQEYTYREVKQVNLMKVIAVDGFGNTGSAMVKIRVNPPQEVAMPAVRSGSDKDTLNDTYRLTFGSASLQYFQFPSNRRVSIEKNFNAGKIRLHDLSDTNYTDQFFAGHYEGCVHFVGHRGAGTTRYILFAGGTVMADPSKENVTCNLWKGVDYAASVAIYTSEGNTKKAGIKIKAIDTNGSTLGTKEVAVNQLSSTKTDYQTTTWKKETNHSGVKIEVNVFKGAEEDHESTNLLDFKFVPVNWPGK